MTVDVEIYVNRIPGRPYLEVAKELQKDGFSQRKNVRLHGTPMKNRVRFTRGYYGRSTNIDIEYGWVDMKNTGISTPGKIISAKIVREKDNEL